MDFFNYAGIHRPVKLYITPTTYLHDITLETDVIDGTGKLNFTTSIATVSKNGKEDSIEILYDVIDTDGKRVAGEFAIFSFHLEIFRIVLFNGT